MRNRSYLRALALFLFAMLVTPALASAQTPPRFYWKTLMGTDGAPVIYQSISGNANPLDPAKVVQVGTQFDAEIVIAGYAKMLPLFGRSALVAVLFPMGRISSETTLNGMVTNDNASGYGDPMIEVAVNIVGPKPIMNIPDAVRYEPGVSIDVIADLAFPIGEYNSNDLLNIGQNRWYGRVGVPMIFQIGSWVPSRRKTLEILPSAWWFSENDNFQGGSLETDLLFQLEGHFTRDFTETFWGSLDASVLAGGKSTIDGTEGTSLNHTGAGFTFGYQLNDNLQMTFGYSSTLNDSDPTELHVDIFRISLVYGWHDLVQGMNRLGGH